MCIFFVNSYQNIKIYVRIQHHIGMENNDEDIIGLLLDVITVLQHFHFSFFVQNSKDENRQKQIKNFQKIT